MAPLGRIPRYEVYMKMASNLRSGNLKVTGCFLCNSIRTYEDGRSVYLCQLARYPTLHVHLACYDHAISTLRDWFPKNSFVESLT